MNRKEDGAVKRKWLAGLALTWGIACLLPLSALAAETGYPDAEGHYAQNAIETWSGHGVLRGYPDGSFRPDGGITRGELAVVLDRVMGYQDGTENIYPDLPDGKWCTDSILRLARQGIFTGDERGRMKPDAPITRQEAFTALARVLEIEENGKASGFSDEAAVADWAKGYIGAMREKGYISGDRNGAVHPGDPITRAEVVTTLDRMAELVNVNGTYTQDSGSNLIVNAQNVTLKDMTVGGDLVVADGVADGDVYLDAVTVKGNIILRGCGENSFHILPGCDVKNIIVTKTTDGCIRLVNESGKTIPMIYVNDGAGGVTLDGGELGSVVVACDAPVKITAQKVKTLSVVGNAGITVEKNAAVERLEVGGTAGKAVITVNGKVTALVNDAGAEVTNNGTVGPSAGSSSGEGGNSGGSGSAGGGSSSGGGSGSAGGGSSSGGGSGSGSGPEEDRTTVISEVALQLLAPRFGAIPDTADVLGVGYTAQTEWSNADGTPAGYRWKPEGEAEDTFTADQEYRAVVTLTPISGYRFGEEMKVTVTDGTDEPTYYTPAQIAAHGEDRVVTMVYGKTEHRDPVGNVCIEGETRVELGETVELRVTYGDHYLVDPASHTWQWYRCGAADGSGRAPIDSAVSREYTVPAEDTREEGEIYYCCGVSVMGQEYISPVAVIEVRDTDPSPSLPDPSIGPELTVTEDGRWACIEIGDLARDADVSYTAQARFAVKKNGADIGGSITTETFDRENISEDGKVSWEIDLTQVAGEYILTMLKADMACDIALGELTVTVMPKLGDTPLENQERVFDTTGKELVFHVFGPGSEIPEEASDRPPETLQFVIGSSTGKFVDKDDPEGENSSWTFQRMDALFRVNGDWVEGTGESFWDREFYVPKVWLEGLQTGTSSSLILCAVYAGRAPQGGMNVYGVKVMGPNIIFQSGNH